LGRCRRRLSTTGNRASACSSGPRRAEFRDIIVRLVGQAPCGQRDECVSQVETNQLLPTSPADGRTVLQRRSYRRRRSVAGEALRDARILCTICSLGDGTWMPRCTGTKRLCEDEGRELTQCLRNGNRSELQGIGSGAIPRERNHGRHANRNLELLRAVTRPRDEAAQQLREQL